MAKSTFIFPGQLAVGGPLLLPDGLLSAPSLAFSAETNSGLYRAGAGDLRIARLGADRFRITGSIVALLGADQGQYFFVQNGLAIVNSATLVLAISGFSKVGISTPSDGVMLLTDSVGTGFSLLQFGGSGTSHPAWKRSGTQLEAVLADQSNWTPIKCSSLIATGVSTLTSAVATSAGGSVEARTLLGTTLGFGVYYGSGAPTVSAAQGSIYLRSDGSSTSTRMYVNTDGGTTWTPFTTSA